jgi:geranylgeranyl pyrophosphate synthase
MELGSSDNLSAEERSEARDLVERGRGIELAVSEAKDLADQAVAALSPLKPTPEKDLLAELALYSANRDR